MIRFLFSLLAFSAVELGAQEWPRFRGENGSGIGKIGALPAEIKKTDYTWAVKLDGVGHSSPVLWGDKLFLTIVGNSGKERRVECYDCITGTKTWTWTAPIETHNLHQHNNFASSTPVVDADAVYVVWGSGQKTEALALDHKGNLIWNRDWPEFSSDHGFAASPILMEGVLVLHTDSVENRRSMVIGLNPKDGATIWELDRSTSGEDEKHTTAYSTPVGVRVGGREVLVVIQTNDGWKGLDPKTGDVLWQFAGDYTQRSVGSIASGDGIVFATLGSGGAGRQSTALRPKKAGDPEVLYSLGMGDGLSYVPTPLIYEGRLYLWSDGGLVTCRDVITGEPIYERERVNGNFFSSPIVADGKIYCGSRDGELIAIKAGDKFEVLGRSKLDSGMNSTPAIANGRLFLRTDTHLICVRGK